LGFNFVRLPLDYRTYTQAGNWDNFIELQVAKIDQAVVWGEQYNVHVCINLHRAPGYCVNSTTLPANQQLNLWTDSVAQKAFVKHWEYFANRYKNIPAERLSFNLVNEPSNVTEAVYVSVMKKAIDAIHKITPKSGDFC
jgi:aryl-phospho-beta-D-glucosidase BglC (GH1 family)